ncbi:MAG: Stk1 family PASTA domain-containing Ser/Thr kinase [Lachnospiraceae bacterium]|nr:Stk1 family PASTA domain-containing Ser/Thr kinase [Lachnospiraceae bacterium]
MVKMGMLIGERYEILEKIGTGGMSDVYKALDHKLNRNVAVKVLKQEFSENENFVSKFRVEAQAAAGLMHQNIVNVYDVGDEKGIYYIVMELVDGITLKKYIEKKQRLTVKEAVSIAIQVAMGLEAAHNNHIIHRDIKPQNIIISKEGKVKVTDFGIAKAATSNTITSNVMGSVHYTSPEQARGGYSDAKSDIYSLGITLFEMLTGRVPFNGDTTVAIAIKHIQEALPTPRDFAPDTPISVEKIVLKCCQKSPDRRYQNAQELITDLKKSLITPDEDFVVIANPDEEGATREPTEAERRALKETSRRSPGKTGDTMRLNAEATRERERRLKEQENSGKSRDGSSRSSSRKKKPVPRKKAKNNKSPKSNTKPIKIQKNRREEEESGGIFDKLVVILAIAAAILVGVMVVYFVGTRLGFFGEDFSLIPGNSAAESGSDEADTAESAEGKTKEPDEGDDGANGILIPDVLGMSFTEAKVELQSKGFSVVRAEDTTSTAARNVVIAMDPKEETRAQGGATITLTVSTGSVVTNEDGSAAKVEQEETKNYKVPELVGQTLEEAEIMIAEAHLTRGSVSEVTYADEALAGKICRQSLEAGNEVPEGSVIDLELSTGTGATTSTWCYVADIESPALEDESYVSGTEVRLTLESSDGSYNREWSTSSFPAGVNVTGITQPTGTLTLSYTVNVPQSTVINPDTGEEETVPASSEERTQRRAITFTPEN